MNIMFKRWFLIILLYCGNSFANPNSLGTAHYLANEGVLVASKHKKIMFDPLFTKNYGRFLLVPDALKAQIFANAEPFNDVDAIFISHSHADHFNAQDLYSYLLKYPRVKLVAPTQAVNKLKPLTEYKRIEKQIREISMAIGDKPREIDENGIKVEIIRVPHVGWPERTEIENLIYRVTIDSTTVMHLGDSDTSVEHYLPYEDFWLDRVTHHAFIPGIFAIDSSSETTVKKLINANNITLIHIPESVPDKLKKLKIDYFSKPNEMRALGKNK